MSYLERYNILCRNLAEERLYPTATVMPSLRTAAKTGEFVDLSELTGLKTFITSFAGHIAPEAAQEVEMSVTYYVALPFLRTEDGVAPGEAQEMPNEFGGDPARGSDGAGRLQCWRARIQAFGRSGNGQFQRRYHFENVRRRAGQAG